jgi:hypothetical protein
LTVEVAVETDTIQIVPIAEEHIESFYRCLDAVARERCT